MVSPLQCTLVGRPFYERKNLSDCESEVSINHCSFKDISENNQGDAVYLQEVTLKFTYTYLYLTNCTSQVDAGGLYCNCKIQILSNLCFHHCATTSRTGHAAHLYLAGGLSTQSLNLPRSSFVLCSKTADI